MKLKSLKPLIRALALKLLKHAHIQWQDCETGAPEISPKRPYGNSDVVADVREILDLPNLTDDTAMEIHKDTLPALQELLGQELDEDGYPKR